MELNELIYLLKLNSVFVYSNTDWIVEFVKKYKPSMLFKNDIYEIAGETELLVEKVKKVVEDAKKFDAEKEINECEKKGIKIISYLDDEYPLQLKDISNPPLVLYVKGSICKRLSLSIVGTRKPTEYGIKYANEFASLIAKTGIVITSGLARGIDTIVHKSALKSHGTTWAVVGCGLNKVYPPENKELFDEIVEKGGAVISEYPVNSMPLKINFPKRNRIISALSFGTFVIEGDYNSGALITARYAIEQGKEVMALPGRIDCRLSNGPNKLISEGAYPIIKVRDILDLIPPQELFGINIKGISEDKKQEIELTEQSRKIYELLKERKELTIDEISIALNISISEVFNYIFELESKQIILSFGGKYRINE